ncbi:alpha/beta fold hydrolase [Spirosoma flavum]|uniref:Alpha/beta fold hydrolase n=1 Tax=Spirosoma flavum TaxID=2048557 RepID=A0ABW6AQ66_9BACT
MQHLGYSQIRLVGHDWGAQVAYEYATKHATTVTKIVVLDVIIPLIKVGQAPLFANDKPLLWWFPFQMVADLPELLVKGREEIYLRWFFTHSTFTQSAITEEAIREYVRCYSAPGGMKAGFSYYRSLLNSPTDSDTMGAKLSMPALVLGGDHGLGTASIKSVETLASKVDAQLIKNCGHYLAEEQPEQLLVYLLPFLVSDQD